MDRQQLQGGSEGHDRVAHAGPRRRARSQALPLLLAALLCTTAGVACGDGGSRGEGDEAAFGAEIPPRGPDLDTILIEAEFVPQWRTPPTPPPAADDAEESEGPRTAAIYLDVSLPMGGFLPTDAAAEPAEGTGANQFRTLVQWIPDQLTRAYTSATLTWHGVGEDVRAISGIPRIERSDFAASESRIDLAIGQALADLRSGRSEAAAIVTDLLGTGENLAPGPLALLPHLKPWLDSAPVRSGELHLGILGAKAAYWGVGSRTCAVQEGLGCWYSERGRDWRRMDDVAPAPFYVLVLGRDADAITTILESIEGDAEGQGIETVAELLTAATRHRPVAGSCLAFAWDDDQRARQYSLRLRDNHEYACVRDEPAALACGFDPGVHPTDVGITDPTDGFAVDATDIGPDGQFEIGVQCDVLTQTDPLPDLRVDVEATLAGDSPLPPWDDWSLDTDDVPSFPGRTLQLGYFVQDVRLAPDYHRTDSMVVLRARDS